MASPSPQSSHKAQYLGPGPGMRVLPGCSAGVPFKKPVTISNCMIKAYVAMRGPGLLLGDDPLFEWIRLREDIDVNERNPAPGDRRDVSQMLAKIDEVLDPLNPAGDSPRDGIFELDRPAIGHILPPADMDLSLHVLSASCAEFELELEEEQDEDGEERYAPSGRISPCTFLAWTQDCKLWDHDEIKVPTEENAERMRPPTPELYDTPPAVARALRKPAWLHLQRDAVDGTTFSPHYPVPSSPSLIYEAEGIEEDRMNDPHFEDHYRRMDPIAAKKLRELKLPGMFKDEVTPAGDGEHYSESEVDRVLEGEVANMKLGFSSPTAFKTRVHQTRQSLCMYQQAADAMAKTIRDQTTVIRNLEHHRNLVAENVELLGHLRREEARRTVAERPLRVKEHLVNHFHELHLEHSVAMYGFMTDRFHKEKNDETIEQLQQDINGLCNSVGKRTLEEVLQECDSIQATRKALEAKRKANGQGRE